MDLAKPEKPKLKDVITVARERLKGLEHERTKQLMHYVDRLASTSGEEYFITKDIIRAGLEDLEEQLHVARDGQISEFSMEDVPVFRQGAPAHEMEELVTADRVKALLTLVLEGVNHLKEIAKLVPIEARVQPKCVEQHPVGNTYVMEDKPQWEAAMQWLKKRGIDV